MQQHSYKYYDILNNAQFAVGKKYGFVIVSFSGMKAELERR